MEDNTDIISTIFNDTTSSNGIETSAQLTPRMKQLKLTGTTDDQSNKNGGGAASPSITDTSSVGGGDGDGIENDVYLQGAYEALSGLTTPRIARRIPLERHQVSCRLCLEDIRGIRWACMDCPNWNVCSRCFEVAAELEVHPCHTFVRVHSPHDIFKIPQTQTHNQTGLQKSLSLPSTIAPVIHLDIVCSSCEESIIGDRYDCMVSSCQEGNGFHLCQDCEALPTQVHPPSHPLIKYKLPIDQSQNDLRFDGASSITFSYFKDRIEFAAANDMVHVFLERKATPPVSSSMIAQSPTSFVPCSQIPLQADILSDQATPWGSTLAPNETFTRSWLIGNKGPRPWPKGTRIQRTSSAVFSAVFPNYILLPNLPLMSGARTEVVINGVKAPSMPGTYIELWRLADETSISFGEVLEIRIAVAGPEVPKEQADLHKEERSFGLNKAVIAEICRAQSAEGVKQSISDSPSPATKVQRPTEPSVKVLRRRTEWVAPGHDQIEGPSPGNRTQLPCLHYGNRFTYRWLVINDGIQSWPADVGLECSSRTPGLKGWIVDSAEASIDIRGGLMGYGRQKLWITLEDLKAPSREIGLNSKRKGGPDRGWTSEPDDDLCRALDSYGETWRIVDKTTGKAIQGSLELILPSKEEALSVPHFGLSRSNGWSGRAPSKRCLKGKGKMGQKADGRRGERQGKEWRHRDVFLPQKRKSTDDHPADTLASGPTSSYGLWDEEAFNGEIRTCVVEDNLLPIPSDSEDEDESDDDEDAADIQGTFLGPIEERSASDHLLYSKPQEADRRRWPIEGDSDEEYVEFIEEPYQITLERQINARNTPMQQQIRQPPEETLDRTMDERMLSRRSSGSGSTVRLDSEGSESSFEMLDLHDEDYHKKG